MTRRTELLIVGAGGLLGSAIRRQRPAKCHALEGIDWTSTSAPDTVRLAVRAMLRTRKFDAVVWSAGAGVIGTGLDALRAETTAFSAVLDALRDHPDTTVMLASSAGGIYGGVGTVPVTEESAECPLSDYGRNKLDQERILTEWCTSVGGRAVIGRISTLYGPGQTMGKGQGLIATLCSSAVTRQPVSIFVSLDTLRDFLYVDDCAALMIGALERASELPSGAVVTKILASGRSLSIGGVIGETRRVCPRPPVIVLGSSPTRTQHGSVLSFRSIVWPDLDRRPLTPVPAGIAATFRSIGAATALSRTR